MTEQAPANPPSQQELAEQEQDNVSRETQQEQEHDEQEHDEQEQELQQTFDRDYVEKLRSKSASYRLRMKDAESQVSTLQRQLFTERLQRLDMVVDPDAVPYDPALLEDEQTLVDAIEELLQSKPYLRKRKVAGNIGQHTSQDGPAPVSLLSVLRNNA